MKTLLLFLYLAAGLPSLAQPLHHVKYFQPAARNYGVMKGFVVRDSLQLRAGAAAGYVLQCTDTFGNARWTAAVAGGDTSLWEYRDGILQPKTNTPVQAFVFTDSIPGFIGFGIDTASGPNGFGIISYDSASNIQHAFSISSRTDADRWERDSTGTAGDFAVTLNSNGFVFGSPAAELLRLNRSGIIIRNGTGSAGDVLTRNASGHAAWAPPAAVTGTPHSIPYIGADDTLVTTGTNLTYNDATGVFQADFVTANCTIRNSLAFYDTSHTPELIFTQDGRTGIGGFPTSAKLYVTNTPQPGINQLVVADTNSMPQFIIDAAGNVTITSTLAYVPGATPGYVLTCADTNGSSAWQEAPGSFWVEFDSINLDSIFYSGLMYTNPTFPEPFIIGKFQVLSPPSTATALNSGNSYFGFNDSISLFEFSHSDSATFLRSGYADISSFVFLSPVVMDDGWGMNDTLPGAPLSGDPVGFIPVEIPAGSGTIRKIPYW